jgi:hypothetical protein
MDRVPLSKIILGNRSASLEEKYEMLRSKLADYLLIQVNTFISGAGERAIGPAVEWMTEKSAEMKISDIKNSGQDKGRLAVDALSKNLADSMGETFNSDYRVEDDAASRTVTLDRCGCIESVLETAGRYEMPKAQAKSIFCGACMSSYRKAAIGLGLGFKGKLSETGCAMSFMEKESGKI